jgi:hypothetical protein
MIEVEILEVTFPIEQNHSIISYIIKLVCQLPGTYCGGNL